MKPRFTVLILAAGVLAATEAAALSCMRPDVRRSYAQAEAAQERYSIVRGRLSFDTAQLPQPDLKNQRARTVTIPGRLSGHGLTAQGFAAPFDRAITLEVSCVGAWCGSARPGRDVLAFLRRDGAEYALEIGPCPFFLFPAPDTAQIAAVVACQAGGPCDPDAPLPE